MKAFDIQVSWPAITGEARDVVDTSFGYLRLLLGGVNITTFEEKEGRGGGERLEQPLYYAAEWIVENWWPLLWEPEKSDEVKDDPDYRSRHSLLTAQHGFALPDLRIIPTGKSVHIFAKARRAEYADVSFTLRGDVLVGRGEVENELRGFVRDIVARLPVQAGEPLRSNWALIEETSDEAADFCRLMGGLGLSPYHEHGRIEAALERVAGKLSPGQLFDLCQTATADDFLSAARVAEIAHDAVIQAPEMDVSALTRLPAPGDNQALPAFRRGLTAARKLRDALEIKEDDVEGATRLFDRLHVDPASRTVVDLHGAASPIAGVVVRSQDRAKLALVHAARSSRRFAAARATFFIWTGEREDRRLMTAAVTRDQQASRAFAAEFLVPQGYIRAQANHGKLSRDRVDQIAERAMVSPDVIRYQAENNGLQLVK